MDQIENLLERPKAYYNIDGVGELGTGFMLLGYALLGWMQIRSPRESVWNRMYMLFIFMGIVLLIVHHGSKAIKKHITYPGTGFVEYQIRHVFWRPLVIGIVFSTLAAIGLFFALRSHWNLATPFSLVGLLLAASYARGFARTVRWKWAVFWIMACGSLAIVLLPADVVGALAKDSWLTEQFSASAVGALWLSLTLYGVMLMISGGISLWLYLRRTQSLPQDVQ